MEHISQEPNFSIDTDLLWGGQSNDEEMSDIFSTGYSVNLQIPAETGASVAELILQELELNCNTDWPLGDQIGFDETVDLFSNGDGTDWDVQIFAETSAASASEIYAPDPQLAQEAMDFTEFLNDFMNLDELN